uniref:Uncharacterized protein n=1 Tax=Arundo donax TaxID=35708 RepID=A0A0A9D4N5_ARUDO
MNSRTANSGVHSCSLHLTLESPNHCLEHLRIPSRHYSTAQVNLFLSDLLRLHPIHHQVGVLDYRILLKVLHGTQVFHHLVPVTSWVLQVRRSLVLHTTQLVYHMDCPMDETCLTLLQICQGAASCKMTGQIKLILLLLSILICSPICCNNNCRCQVVQCLRSFSVSSSRDCHQSSSPFRIT